MSQHLLIFYIHILMRMFGREMIFEKTANSFSTNSYVLVYLCFYNSFPCICMNIKYYIIFVYDVLQSELLVRPVLVRTDVVLERPLSKLDTHSSADIIRLLQRVSSYVCNIQKINGKKIPKIESIWRSAASILRLN